MTSDTPARQGSRHPAPPLAERLEQKGLRTTITLADYLGLLEGTGSYIIPCYQRGYVWGQRDRSGALDSATHLARTLRDSLGKGNVFLQGITVHEVPGRTDLVLVDGQQRTTFLYLLLRFLDDTGFTEEGDKWVLPPIASPGEAKGRLREVTAEIPRLCARM